MKNRHNTSSGFTIIEVALGILVLALLGYIVWTAVNASNSKQANESPASNSQAPKKETPDEGLDWKRIESGQKAFSVQIPDGWGEVLRPTTENMLVIMGQKQPTYTEGQDVTVKDLDGFGTDAPSLFTILIHDNIADPRGTAADFSIGDLAGKKYTYVAPVDTEQGLGQEDAGDKQYGYWFDLDDGKKLVVFYHVYVNTDNRDQVETVDKIVKSIKLAQ